jgi:hypothetical protein
MPPGGDNPLKVVDMRSGGAYIPPSVPVAPAEVQFGGSGGGRGPVDPKVSMKDYVDARDDAIESRLSAQLDKLPTAASMRNNIWGAALTVLGILLAILAFGGDRFEAGMSVSPQIVAGQQAQRKTDDSQDARLEMMDRKLDILINQTASK